MKPNNRKNNHNLANKNVVGIPSDECNDIDLFLLVGGRTNGTFKFVGWATEFYSNSYGTNVVAIHSYDNTVIFETYGVSA